MALGRYLYLLILMKLFLFRVTHFWWHYYAWHFAGCTQQSVEAILLSLLQIRSVPWSFGNTEFGMGWDVFPNFQSRVVLVWKNVCFPKGSSNTSLLKTKSDSQKGSQIPAFRIPIIFQGGLDVIFLLAVIFRARKEPSNWSQRSWMLKFVTSDSPKNDAVPHPHPAVDGWWSSKILTTWHLQN